MVVKVGRCMEKIMKFSFFFFIIQFFLVLTRRYIGVKAKITFVSCSPF